LPASLAQSRTAKHIDKAHFLEDGQGCIGFVLKQRGKRNQAFAFDDPAFPIWT
jgi:hypothetical protein